VGVSEQQQPVLAVKAAGLQDRVLRLIAGAFCDCGFSWGALETLGVRQGFSGAELSVANVRLRASGLLTANRQSGGQITYALTAAGLQQAYALSSLYPSNPPPDGTDGCDNREGGGARQMFRFLVHAVKQPLPLTRSGQVTARALSAAASRVGMASEAVSFCLKAALTLGLLTADRSVPRLCCVPHALSGWLAQGWAGMDAALYRLWLADHLTDEPLLRHLGWLGHLANGHPASLGELARKLAHIAGAEEADGEAHRQRWALPLAAMGWALLAELENGLCSCTLSVPNPFAIPVLREGGAMKGAPASGRMVWCIQPDYEVWVTDGLQDAVSLWQLALLCEERLGEDGCYALTPAAWGQALANGRSGDEWIRFLWEHSLDGIPDNVLAALTEWTGASGTQEPDDMMAKPMLQTPAAHAAAPDSYPLLLHSNELSPLPDRLPAVNDLFPDLRAIPASWLKDCRTYHTTTQQLIIRQAMAWKTFLHIETETEQVQMLPCELACDERGMLVVEGWMAGEATALPLAADCRLGICLPELSGLGE
jgi:hypothetical protein